MLALPKKTDYGLIALQYLMERPGRVAPAREIAEQYHLPCALLMNVMKELQHGGLVKSVRGARGGYQLNVDPSMVSLYDVVVLTSGEPHLTECCGGLHAAEAEQVGGEAGAEARDGETGTDDVAGSPAVSSGAMSAGAMSVGPSGRVVGGGCSVRERCPVQVPLRRLHDKLVAFLKGVKLSDLLGESGRIDVPLESVGVRG